MSYERSARRFLDDARVYFSVTETLIRFLIKNGGKKHTKVPRSLRSTWTRSMNKSKLQRENTAKNITTKCVYILTFIMFILEGCLHLYNIK